MRKFFTLCFCLVLGFSANLSFAQEFDPTINEQPEVDEIAPDRFYRAVVTEIVEQDETDSGTEVIQTQVLKAKFTDGDLKDQEKELINDGLFNINGGEPLEVGDKIIVFKTGATGQEMFYIADVYRVPPLMFIIALFFLIAVALSRWKGFMSMLGLGLSILVIVQFVVPQIIAGRNPLVISLIGTVIIALISIYLAHGFNRRTTIALISTMLTLGLAALMSVTFVRVTRLFGLGSEEAFYVQQIGALPDINLQGLLLGGIILGALGVLDDITTAQTAAVYEIKRANTSLSTSELYKRGIRVGREHISSLVNTLFLAYAGASLPLFLFFSVGGTQQPLWVTLNSEFIAEEIIRTLVGSIALMLAVPITTFLAAYYFGNRPQEEFGAAETPGHSHSH